MKYRMLLRGIATWIPGTSRFHSNKAGATESAHYCYSVWLRHLVKANESGLNPYPKVVAELGPGNSLGVGIAALLSGCDEYIALDVAPFAAQRTNLEVFDDLVTLFRGRTDVPGDDVYPNLKPKLESYQFPHQILDDKRLNSALDSAHLTLIRQWTVDVNGEGSQIKYVTPWHDHRVINENYVDLIMSQAVLEHIDNLSKAYQAMDLWLKPTGFMSHQIDYKSHGTAKEWNGHWAYSELIWKLMKGKRAYFLNREPHSTHVRLLRQQGYRIVCEKRVKSESGLSRSELGPRYSSILEQDLTTSGSFIQVAKEKFASKWKDKEVQR